MSDKSYLAMLAYMESSGLNFWHYIKPVKKPVLSDHDQAIKMNAAFDKRQRKNSKRVKS